MENLPPWAIPNFGKEVYRFEVMPVKPWNDSDQLFQRGDVYGFIGILAALRHAVITDEPELVHHHCANAHSALASLGRNDTFRPFWARLSIALFRLQKYLGQTDIVPCLSKIREQIDADQYLTSDNILARRSKHTLGRRGQVNPVSHNSTVVSAKKCQVVKVAGRAGQSMRYPHLWGLRPFDRGAVLR